jgi:hypothetical protein
MVRSFSIGVSRLRNYVGSKLIRKRVVIKASSQHFNGMEVLASKARPISTI